MTTAEQKKWRLMRTYLAKHPVWLAWQVTYRCNFRCRFCHYWQDEMGRQPEQTVAEFESGAKKLAKWGTLLISLAGGEPLLREDIVDIVEVVGRWHFPFITTNGYRTDPHLTRELFRAGLWGVSISIDYADPQPHNRARGMADAYEKAVAALEAFSHARQYPWQRVNLMCVLLDDNADQIEPLIKLAAEHNAYFMIQPYCSMKTGSSKFRHRNHDGISRYLLELRSKYRNFLSNPWFLSNFDAALNGGVPGCMAGRTFFNIDSTGDIAICVENRNKPVANLHRDDITEISNRLRQAARANHCQACWYNCRGEVESIYRPYGLLKSLPTWIFDYGRPRKNTAVTTITN